MHTATGILVAARSRPGWVGKCMRYIKIAQPPLAKNRILIYKTERSIVHIVYSDVKIALESPVTVSDIEDVRSR